MADWARWLAPLAAALAGSLAQKLVHRGVEVGLLRLLAVTALMAVVPPFIRHLGSPRQAFAGLEAAACAVAVVAATSALFVYPLPGWVATVVLLAAICAPCAVAVEASIGRDAAQGGAPVRSLALILVGLLVLRWGLEPGEVPWNPRFNGRPATDAWRLLLPAHYEEGRYTWSATGFLPLLLLQAVVSNKTAYVLSHVALTLATFTTTWTAYRSRALTLTVTACMAFGTQFYYVYAFSGCIIFLLMVMYVEVNLLALLRLFSGQGDRRWRALFVASLVACALCYDTWLDYAAFLLSTCGLFAWLGRGRDCPWDGQLRFVAVVTVLTMAGYLVVRLRYVTEFSTPGHEHELVLSHASSIAALEDVVTNWISYLYMGLTNFFPPPLVVSSALLVDGERALVAAQSSYEPQHTSSVALHYIHSWYFAAGAFGLAFFVVGARLARAAGRDWRALHGCVVWLLVATGSLTHCLVKFRPFLSQPTLSYKCTLSVLGVSLALGHAMALARRRCTARAYRALAVTLCLVVVAGALTRPRMLAALNGRYLGTAPPPDPLRTLGVVGR